MLVVVSKYIKNSFDAFLCIIFRTWWSIVQLQNCNTSLNQLGVNKTYDWYCTHSGTTFLMGVKVISSNLPSTWVRQLLIAYFILNASNIHYLFNSSIPQCPLFIFIYLHIFLVLFVDLLQSPCSKLLLFAICGDTWLFFVYKGANFREHRGGVHLATQNGCLRKFVYFFLLVVCTKHFKKKMFQCWC